MVTLLLLNRVVLFCLWRAGGRQEGPYQSWEAKVLFFKIKWDTQLVLFLLPHLMQKPNISRFSCVTNTVACPPRSASHHTFIKSEESEFQWKGKFGVKTCSLRLLTASMALSRSTKSASLSSRRPLSEASILLHTEPREKARRAACTALSISAC